MTANTRRLVLARTESVCPVCLKTVAAERYVVGDTVYLGKTCAEHGTFDVPIWRGASSYLAWGSGRRTPTTPAAATTSVASGCPRDCGLCPDHRQDSCCVLIEVTARCDLACPVCYASAGGQSHDPSLDDIDRWLGVLNAAGGRVHIQLSGGEPTQRDDLAEVVALVRRRGFDFVQLNTNGVRIGREPDYLARLVEAGLDCVFLQFDGLTDASHVALRGRPLAAQKQAAIAAARAAGVGVVLVPTLLAGVNVGEIGAIVEFAKANSPTVRAVHFQPASQFGRFETAGERVTLPEVMAALVAHEHGAIRLADFHPGSAENPYCSFSGRFQIGDDGRLAALGDSRPSCGCGSGEDVNRERRYVAGQWRLDDGATADGLDAFDRFLASRRRTLGLSAMVFQDAWTLDLERLRQCHIHIVSPDARVIPFCAYNLTSVDGTSLYRGASPVTEG
jgi:uncharacterized radical SAM superfamily Fe-S cluster-containing enzyme